MKKIIAMIITAAMAAGCFAGCNAASSAADPTDPLQIVTTIFPEYDWVKTIMGDKADNAEITLLLDNGVDLHSYQPTAEDIMKIASCDLFIYVGGESDDWVEDALAEATNKDMEVINLLEILGDSVKVEEVVEGMEHNHENEHSHSEIEAEAVEEEELDEHVWLSLKRAVTLGKAITESLAKLDAANADVYNSNYDTYKEQLEKLDGEYKEAVDAADNKVLLFGDRFPFRYLVDDYGLDYFAAFAGCSAESEASFETIVFLSGKVDELGLNTILTVESSDGKIANTIKENTTSKDQQILVMDSLQSATTKDSASGTTYLSVMTSNLEVLKEALR